MEKQYPLSKKEFAEKDEGKNERNCSILQIVSLKSHVRCRINTWSFFVCWQSMVMTSPIPF